MSPWEIIGWAIAVPMIALSAMFVFAVTVAVAKAIVRGPKRTVSKDHPSNVTPLKK